MTLIIGAMCERYAVQVSDRRLSHNGTVVDDEQDKATVLTCNNARFAIGFTGLARYGNFDTHSWMLKTLRDAGPPEFTALELTQRFTAEATNYFNNSSLLREVPKREKRITFMFNGFVTQPQGPMPAALLVTNYQDWGQGDQLEPWSEFRSTYFGLRENWEAPLTWVQRIGAWQALRNDHESLQELLRQGRPANAVVGKAIKLIAEAADRKEAHGLIGKQLSSIILPSDSTKPPQVGYHTGVSSYTLYLPSIVVTTTANQLIVSDAQLRKDNPLTAPFVVAKVPRNQQCPCGSGNKYKFCHGRAHRQYRPSSAQNTPCP
jgi:hypothetical protein